MTFTCRHCGRESATPEWVCSACKRVARLQSALDVDVFTLLQIAPAFDVPRAKLESAYLKLTKALHPDAFRGRDEDQESARRLTALINDAYATLRDPIRRARALVQLWGGAEVAADKSVAPHFLEEQLTWRESAAEGADKLELQRLAGERLRADEAKLALQFAGVDTGNREAHMRAAQRLLNEMNFYRTFLRDLEGSPSEAAP